MYVCITYDPQMTKGSDDTIFQNNLFCSGFGEGYPKLDLFIQRRELSFGERFFTFLQTTEADR